MKNYKGNFILTFVPFLAFMAGARMFSLETMLDSKTRSIQYFIKEFFLYRDFIGFNGISVNDLMFCFTALLFIGYNLNISLYGVTKKYRSMILLRYGSRKSYFMQNYKFILSRSFRLTASSSLSFFLASWINRIPFDFSESEASSVIFLIANLFLFLHLLGLINIYCVIKYRDTTALLMTSLFTSVLLLADAFEQYFAVITYGNIWSTLRGNGIACSM